ncbi:MAG: sugar ABC transporter substrate-binding protein [Spirochaetes bacterium]|nr:MAG: sugar ABC transporter substrate-binding protein [Spirochaetota bacterium]
MRKLFSLIIILIIASTFVFAEGQREKESVEEIVASGAFPADKIKDINIRFFAGGEPGGAFASIVYRGAQDAEKLLGCKVSYVFSGWDPEKMVAQLRDAIAARPDGIAMMGHPGDDAIMPLAEKAAQEGILMMYQNVDVPEVRKRFGGGYIGANLYSQGAALAEEALKRFNLKKGDRVIVFGNWGMPGRYIREQGSADVFEKNGLVVDKQMITVEQINSPELLLPVISGALLAHPETKLILYSNSTNFGTVPLYMETIGKKPGEIINIGFDTSPAIIDAFRKGYVQLASDQQPYLQGFLPIVSLVLTKLYGFSPLSYDTGAGFVTEDNFERIAPLAEAGIR